MKFEYYRLQRLLAGCVCALLWLAPFPVTAREAPPDSGTALRFEKTLFVQNTSTGKIFSESRQVASGENLWRILSSEYGISSDAIPTFLAAFRSVNPDMDPNRLLPGSVVRIPFKLEQIVGGTETVASADDGHVVQPGENLWTILKNSYGVPRSEMGKALAAVASTNPNIKDLNKLFVGQRLVIPATVGRREIHQSTPPNRLPVPATYFTVLQLLRNMACEVEEEGETFLPLERGRTVRLNAKDFPLITSPAGKKVVLDPKRRLSAALARSIEQTWGYAVLQGTEDNAEAQLARVLPRLGLYEVQEGLRTITVGSGAEIKALARWTVIPRAEDLWEGRIHLFFRSGNSLDPVLATQLRELGFVIHTFGPLQSSGEIPPPVPVARMPMGRPEEGAGQLLGLLGIPHRLHPTIECGLESGVSYRLRPDLTFRHAGLDYATVPRQPANADKLLARAGYFTIPWQPGVNPLNLLTDLLSLLGIPHVRTSLEVPATGSLRLQVEGIVLESQQIAGFLYPIRSMDSSKSRIFLTEAQLPQQLAALFLEQNLLPWVLEAR